MALELAFFEFEESSSKIYKDILSRKEQYLLPP
jgi:hypothetical protein